jgi:hypothetical protein
VRKGEPPREEDSVSVWWPWVVRTSSVCLALLAKNMGRTGPIPPPTPVEDPWAALLVGALLWALVSVLVATESANAGMRRRAWGWAASFVCASLVAAYSFGRLV